MTKYVELTGSPKPYFETKEEFMNAICPFGYEHSKMTKKDNKCNILITNDLSSTTSKMALAKSLGVEIMTYEEIASSFDIL